MNTLSVVAYLGVILAGCAVVSVADSFSATEVAARLRIAGARAIITQDVLLRGGKHLPLYERFLEAVRLEPEAIGGTRAIVACAVGTELSCHIRDNQSVPDMSWHRLLGMVTDMEVHLFEAYAPTGENAASATTNILFSSGTTGEPKAIPWTHVTPIRSAIDGLAHHDIRPGDIVCWPTNLVRLTQSHGFSPCLRVVTFAETSFISWFSCPGVDDGAVACVCCVAQLCHDRSV